MSDHTKFDYLLNAMERAGQSHNPHMEGYGDKRRALFAHVRAMEAAVKAAKAALHAFSNDNPLLRHDCETALRQALAEIGSDL
jgi:hypothetical protein